MTLRTLAWADPKIMDLTGSGDPDAPVTPIEPADESKANLVSSLLLTGEHAPLLDIDFEARLLPSSTHGHYHLYLDGLSLDWPAYVELLEALAKAGVIQQGYLRHSLERKQTVVRRPGVIKGATTDEHEEPT